MSSHEAPEFGRPLVESSATNVYEELWVDVAQTEGGLWLGFGQGFGSQTRLENPRADVVQEILS